MTAAIAAAASASAVAVGRTLAVCLAGWFFARYRANAGGATTWRDTARVTAEFFTPCLVLSVFPKGINATLLRELWPVAALGTFLPCLWLAVGAAGAFCFLPRNQRHLISFAAVTVAYPNAFAIPYPLLLALTREVDWLESGPDADAFSAAVTMLFSFCLLLQVWTVAFAIYGRASSSAKQSKQAEERAGSAEMAELEAPSTPSGTPRAPAGVAGAPKEFFSVLPAASQGAADGPTMANSSSLTSIQEHGRALGRAIKEILNPLVVSLFVALIIAVSPLREPFVESPIFDALEFVAGASVPLTLVQIGAGMSRPPALTDGAAGDLQLRSALTVVFLRLVVANIIGSAIVATCMNLGLIVDKHVALCLFLFCCSPTAANVSLVSSVQQAYVQPTAMVLFLMHIAAVPTMLLSIAIYIAVLS